MSSGKSRPARVCGSVFFVMLGACNSTTAGDGDPESESSALGSDTRPQLAPECGNGVLEMGEACDDANDDNHDDCVEDCVEAVCGDGFRHGELEACDDGNRVDDDGCNNACQVNFHPLCSDSQLPTLSAEGRYVDGVLEDALMARCDRTGAAMVAEDWVGPGWYRLGPGFNHFIPEEAPDEPLDCGTAAAGWLTTPSPHPEEGAVSGMVCFATAEDDCAAMVEIQLISCGFDPKVARLEDVPSCDMGYCLDTMTVP